MNFGQYAGNQMLSNQQYAQMHQQAAKQAINTMLHQGGLGSFTNAQAAYTQRSTLARHSELLAKASDLGLYTRSNDDPLWIDFGAQLVGFIHEAADRTRQEEPTERLDYFAHMLGQYGDGANFLVAKLSWNGGEL